MFSIHEQEEEGRPRPILAAQEDGIEKGKG